MAEAPVFDPLLKGLEPDEELIPYRPNAALERWIRHRFSAWSEAKAWFVMTLVVLFFSFGGPGFVLQGIIWLLVGSTAASSSAAAAAAINQTLLLGVLMLLTGAAAALQARIWSQPTHIGISGKGIRFHWRRLLGARSGRFVSWDRLEHVYLSRPNGRTSPQDYLVCFRSDSGGDLRIKLGAVVATEERARLLAAVNEYAPRVHRDPEVLEVLTPPQDHSYTELWLQALSAPPKRERLTPLPDGASLQNGRYVVSGQLGVGGQGTAYLACCLHADKNGTPLPQDETVVLKESILPVYVDVSVRKQALEQFQNESVMLRQLDHPQIVRLIDYFVEDHRSYLVLEHIDGPSLRGLVERGGRLPETRVRELALQMCDILAYLHALTPPVVHRDFTPDNLILGADGTLKLVDFNVAHQSESTATGTVVGKHAYIPPEQFRGKPTPQSDIYAMGATLYYLLVGEDPEPITCSHPVLARPELSAELDALVARATAIDARQRYGEIAELRGDLLNSSEKSGTYGAS